MRNILKNKVNFNAYSFYNKDEDTDEPFYMKKINKIIILFILLFTSFFISIYSIYNIIQFLINNFL